MAGAPPSRRGGITRQASDQAMAAQA